MRRYFLVLVLLAFLAVPSFLGASDHADPALPSEFDPELVKEPNITGLFVFPEGDQLIVIFNVFRSLSSPPPYKFEDYEFLVYMDLHSKVDFDDAQVRARYGGHVVHPEGIKPDVTIAIDVDNGNRHGMTLRGSKRYRSFEARPAVVEKDEIAAAAIGRDDVWEAVAVHVSEPRCCVCSSWVAQSCPHV